MWRILDFSRNPARLSLSRKQLVVKQAKDHETRIPFSEIAVVIAAHPQITYTQAVLTSLVEAGGVFVTCGANMIPTGMLLPLAGHYVQVERFTAQAGATAPVKKRLWKRIVQAKLRAQGQLLKERIGHDGGLNEMASTVRSGDADNREATGARKYWHLLFSSVYVVDAFHRNPNLPGANALLNYGYAVVRAIVARAICAAGLHPALGLHHHNRYGAFPLADDLMEPLRPLVDRTAVAWVEQHGEPNRLEPCLKEHLLTALLGHFRCKGERRSLFDITNRIANRVADVYLGKGRQLAYPQVGLDPVLE